MTTSQNRTNEKNVLRIQVNYFVRTGLYFDAAKTAYDAVEDHDEANRPRTEFIQEAMQGALDHGDWKAAGKIVAEFRDYVSDEQRTQLTEIDPKVG